MHTQKLSVSVKDTLSIGRYIARHLKQGDILCFSGSLGSGKTVLAKGIALGLGIPASSVISPSFVLIREHYSKKFPFYHFDLYRLKDPKDILRLGYEEYLFGHGVSVVEWPQRLKYLLPKNFLGVELLIKGSSLRLLKFRARGSRYKELVKAVNENIRD